MTLLLVNLKAYFGYRETLEWSARIAESVSAGAAGVTVGVLPSFPALPAVRDIVAPAGIAVGAQDLAADDAPAQTGEVLASALAELDCRYVVVGHAERRRLFGETEQVVAAKTAAALRHAITPVICVGETERGEVSTAVAECRRQLAAADVSGGGIVVAYEPVWAIGADRPAPEDYIAEVCADLRGQTANDVIYGGSAGPGLLTRLGDAVDGLFLGRFAHDPAAFGEVLAEAGSRD